jgi:hypothetical protein
MYFLVAPIFGGFVNYGVANLIAGFESPLIAQFLGAFLSLIAFTVIALVIAQETRLKGLWDIRFSCLALLMAVFGTCAMSQEFFNEFADMLQRSFENGKPVGRLWLASSGLGLIFGVIVLSVRSFWNTPGDVEKEKRS